jgi:hypothetical protein
LFYYTDIKRSKIKELEKTTGTITYMIRLDPDYVPMAEWRQCTAHEYITTIENRHFGGFVQTKTILNMYNGERKELEL